MLWESFRWSQKGKKGRKKVTSIRHSQSVRVVVEVHVTLVGLLDFKKKLQLQKSSPRLNLPKQGKNLKPWSLFVPSNIGRGTTRSFCLVTWVAVLPKLLKVRNSYLWIFISHWWRGISFYTGEPFWICITCKVTFYKFINLIELYINLWSLSDL